MSDSRSSPIGYVYRGVHAHHPALAAALTGVVVPGDVNGTITPEQHNLRDISARSPFTSWTHLRDVAVAFAESSGSGGVVLRLPVGTPSPGSTWKWVGSPDVWLEQEVLLHGVRIGAEVTRL